MLFDFGATHSFASTMSVKGVDRDIDKIGQIFKTALPSVEAIIFSYWLRLAPIVIAGRKSRVDLVILDMSNYDVMVEMGFLTKHGAQ